MFVERAVLEFTLTTQSTPSSSPWYECADAGTNLCCARGQQHSQQLILTHCICLSIQSSLRKLIPFGNRVLVKRVEPAVKVRPQELKDPLVFSMSKGTRMLTCSVYLCVCGVLQTIDGQRHLPPRRGQPEAERRRSHRGRPWRAHDRRHFDPRAERRRRQGASPRVRRLACQAWRGRVPLVPRRGHPRQASVKQPPLNRIIVR